MPAVAHADDERITGAQIAAADAVALCEGIMQQPFERAPGRMHLDAALESPVMSAFDIRVAAANMGDDHRVLASKRVKQLAGGVNGRGRGRAFDQDVRRAADGAAFAPEEDVTVAAHAGIAGPFVARQAHEAAGHIERGRQPIELGPERIGDLKIVALMADDVDEGFIARIAEIAFRRAHADGFAALSVQIAPIAPQRRGPDHAQRIGAGNLPPIYHQPQVEIAARLGDNIVQHARALAAPDHNALRQAA